MTNKQRQKKKRITESKNKVPKLVTFSVDDEMLMSVRDSDFSEDEPCTSNVTGRGTFLDIRLLAAQTMKKVFTVSFVFCLLSLVEITFKFITIEHDGDLISDC